MKIHALITTGCFLLLVACTQQGKQDVKQSMHTDADRMQNAFQLEVQETNRSIQEWLKPRERPEPKPIATSSYCYHAYGDVVCYKNPVPKGDERLVGYQEPPLPEPVDVNALPLPAVTSIKASKVVPPFSQARPQAPAGDKSEAEQKKPLNPYEPRPLIPSAL